jgi:hypothetical protein
MPFSDEFNDTWESIQEVCTIDCQLETDRADTRNVHPKLPDNIFHHIDESDITVIDVSDLNSNVIFEFGYAAAKEKYILPITKGEVKNLPTDLKAYIFLSYSDGSSDQFKIELRNRLREEIKRIRSDREKRILEEKTHIVKPSFEVKCYVNRDEANLKTVFAGAEKDIKILQSNLSTVVSEYVDSIKTALDKKPGLKVSFLALDPESYFAAVRARQLGQDVSEFRNELHTALYELYKTFRNNERVEIRIYDDFPTQISFIVDNTIYNGVVSKYQQSRNNCIFKLNDVYPSLHTSFVLHFTSVWRDQVTTRKYLPFSCRNIPKCDD